MKLKKFFALLLCLTVLAGCFVGFGALPAAAAQQAGKAVVPFRSPAILADVGEAIDLTKYSVEFSEDTPSTDALTWTKDGAAVTTLTPSAAGVTPLVVKDSKGTTKNVYVVVKAAADSEYVLYRNDFDTAEDAAELTVVEGGITTTINNGRAEIVPKRYASVENYIRLPEWLGEFGDYKMTMRSYTIAYGSGVAAADAIIGFYCRGQNVDNAKNAYLARFRHTAAKNDSFIYTLRDENGSIPWYSFGSHQSLRSKVENEHIFVMKAHDNVLSQELIYKKTDAETVFHSEEEKALRTGYLGFMFSNISISVDYITVTIDAPVKAPVSATFTPDADGQAGTIGGKLSVQLDSVGAQPMDVVYYWGNGEGKLPGYASFDRMLVKSGATTVEEVIPAGTIVPKGATELRVYTYNYDGESDSYITIPLPQSVQYKDLGQVWSSFQVASDMHIMDSSNLYTQWNDEHFAALLERIYKNDPDSLGLFIGGDIVDSGSTGQYKRFAELVEKHGHGIKLDGIIGNHEYWGSDDEKVIFERFQTAMGITDATPEKPYYSKTVNGIDFFFLYSVEKEGSSSSHNKSKLGDEQLAWLEEGLAEADKTKSPILIFHHQKFNQIIEASQLKAILKQYPEAIFITSHSHEDMNQDGGTFDYATSGMCNTLNTSSVSFVISTHYNSSTEYEERQRMESQAYYVEVYEGKTVFRGINVLNGEWLPSAYFVFDYTVDETTPAPHLKHTYGDWTVTKEATAQEAGEERRECTECDHYETREIPKLIKTGWNLIDGKWYYVGADGAYITNKWMKDSKGWVKLGADGAMLTNAWTTDSKGWCFVGADGYAVTNCWKKDSKGWIWLNGEGSMTKSKWIQDGGKWYYLDAAGYMVTNKWQKDSKGWVKLGADGAMLTNKWTTDSKGWCYVGANGYAVTNTWKKDNTGWIYLDKEGSMTKAKWVLSGGKWYYCDGNGYMVAGKSMKIGNKTYKFNASGVCTNP